ncbi:MAG: hypothetical protein WAN22_14090 [Solirubrobacteraceae bacterium]
MANLTMPLSAAATSAWVSVGAPVFGSRCRQALWATGNCGLLASGMIWFFGIVPLLFGSGKLDTPWDRMQLEKATAPVAGDDAAAEVLVEDEAEDAPPHPHVSSATPTAAMMAASGFMPTVLRAGR